MTLQVGDRVDVDAAELGRCIVERIDGRYAFVRAQKASKEYEHEPGDPYLFGFRADHLAERKVSSGGWWRRSRRG